MVRPRHHRLARALAGMVLLAASTTLPAPASSAAGVFGPFPDGSWFLYATHVDLAGGAPSASWFAAERIALAAGGPARVYGDVLAGADHHAVVAPLVRLYQAAFGRPPDVGGFDHWARAMRQGWTLEQVTACFIGAPEFQARFGAPADPAFVDLLYLHVLGRQPDPGGRAYWVARLAHGLPRASLLVAFAQSSENRAVTQAVTEVTSLYLGMLRRPPDSAGLAHWSAAIGPSGSAAGVAVGILGSSEHRARWAGPFPPAPDPVLRVALFGDSLPFEARDYLTWLVQAGGRAQVELRVYGGTAICDWFGHIVDLRDNWRPQVMVIAVAGNAMTPCMAGSGSGEAYATKYRNDALRATALATAGGAWVLWVTPPAMRSSDTSPVVAAMVAAAATDPARVSVLDGGTLVSPGGVYADHLPCLPEEPCPAGGVIQVRNPDGVHFCPAYGAAFQCAAYSSGAYRYAATIVALGLRRFGIG